MPGNHKGSLHSRGWLRSTILSHHLGTALPKPEVEADVQSLRGLRYQLSCGFSLQIHQTGSPQTMKSVRKTPPAPCGDLGCPPMCVASVGSVPVVTSVPLTSNRPMSLCTNGCGIDGTVFFTRTHQVTMASKKKIVHLHTDLYTRLTS